MATAKPIMFVVDDDVSVRESLELLIDNGGWQPKTFASAQDFLDSPRTAVPSCLLLDISLPGLNGLELLTEVPRDLSLISVKDSKKYAATGVWGFGDFNNGKRGAPVSIGSIWGKGYFNAKGVSLYPAPRSRAERAYPKLRSLQQGWEGRALCRLGAATNLLR